MISAIEGICNMALLYAGVNKKIADIKANNPESQACDIIYDQVRQNLYTHFRWKHTIKRSSLIVLSGAQYDAGYTFSTGDFTQFGANLYKSLLDNNTGNEPDLPTSAAWWKQVTRDGWAYVCVAPDDMLDAISMWESPSTNVNALPNVDADDDEQDELVIRAPTSRERQPFEIENADDGTDSEVILTDLDSPVLRYVKDVTNPAAMPPKFIETFAWHLSVPLASGLRNDLAKAQFCEKMAIKTLGEAFATVMRGTQEDPEPPSEFELSRRGSR